MSIKKRMIVALLAGLTAIISTVVGADQPPPKILSVACATAPAIQLAGSVDCFELAIPIDRGHRSAGNGAMSFAIVRAWKENSKLPPLLFLMGGNGAGVGLITRQPSLVRQVSKSRNVILLDHRGAGSSRPSARCQGFDDAVAVSMASATRLRACAGAQHNAGIDPNLFGPAQAAADIRDLRLALGVSAWDLYAVSYGTRMAKSLMEIDASGIRAAVLDGVYGWSTNAWSRGDLLEPIIGMLDGCHADAACRSTFPDLEGRLTSVLNQLKARPAILQGKLIGPVEFMTGIQGALGIAEGRPRIPMVIDRASRGQFDLWEELNGTNVADETPPHRDPSLTFYGQACREEFLLRSEQGLFPPPTRQLSKIIAASTQLDWPGSMQNFCGLLGYRPASASELVARISSIPTLMLNGEIDMNTPLHAAQRALRYFTHVYSVTFPLTGHWVLRRDKGCAMSIVESFYLNPLSPPITSCVDAMPTLHWATERADPAR